MPCRTDDIPCDKCGEQMWANHKCATKRSTANDTNPCKDMQTERLSGRDTSLLALIAQSGDAMSKEEKRQIMASLDGQALEIAKVLVGESKNPKKINVAAANRFVAWANNLSNRKVLKIKPKQSITIDMLCEACELLDEAKLLSKTSKKLQKWYKDHSDSEINRVKLEAAQKLSARERKALGINIEELKKNK